jgi:hypothetical protein
MTTRGVNSALPDVDAGASFALPDFNVRGLMETRGRPSVLPDHSRLTA